MVAGAGVQLLTRSAPLVCPEPQAGNCTCRLTCPTQGIAKWLWGDLWLHSMGLTETILHYTIPRTDAIPHCLCASHVARREFAKRLWGDLWFHPEDRVFRRTAPRGGPGGERSFVQFVLEPLYKMYSTVIGERGWGLGAAGQAGREDGRRVGTSRGDPGVGPCWAVGWSRCTRCTARSSVRGLGAEGGGGGGGGTVGVGRDGRW